MDTKNDRRAHRPTPSGRSTGPYLREVVGEAGGTGQDNSGTARSAPERLESDGEAGRLIQLIKSQRPAPCPHRVSRIASQILARLGQG
jgi:hypothetical protein